MELDSRIGELAALGTATCWAGSALLFEAAGKRIGSLSVNLIRLVPALLLLTLYGLVVHGQIVPVDLPARSWFYLVVSGWIGFVIGDMCLFRALVVLGTRLSTLVMSLWPSFAALLGWLVLGESLGGWDVLGMTLTMAGIGMAVLERAPVTTQKEERNLRRGLPLAIGGALGQAGGLVLSKLGMGSGDPFAATQVRVIAGLLGFAILFSAIGWWSRVRAGVRDRRALAYACCGAGLGPFLGVSLSLFAVQHTATGVGASLMATTPILIIPLVVLLRRERVGPLAVLGTLIAVGGVAILMLF